MDRNEAVQLIEDYCEDDAAIRALVDLALSREKLFEAAAEQISSAVLSQLKDTEKQVGGLDTTPSARSPANAYWRLFIRIDADLCFAIAFDDAYFVKPQVGIWYDHVKSPRDQARRRLLNDRLNGVHARYSAATYDYWIAAGDAARLFPRMSATDSGANLSFMLSVDFARDFVKEARRAAVAMRAALQELGSEHAGMPQISDQTSAGIG